jgi:hypothetical protein
MGLYLWGCAGPILLVGIQFWSCDYIPVPVQAQFRRPSDLAATQAARRQRDRRELGALFRFEYGDRVAHGPLPHAHIIIP